MRSMVEGAHGRLAWERPLVALRAPSPPLHG
jgi:hypothetical protein